MLNRFFIREKLNVKTRAPKTRRLRLESLEERALLSVTPLAGAEMLETRAAFAFLENKTEINVIELGAAFTSQDAQAAFDAAKATPQDDLIVARVNAENHTLTLDGNPLVVDVAPENGGVYFVAVADDGSNASLTIDTQNMSRAFSVLRGDVGLANLDIYGQTWSFDQGAAYDGLIRVRNAANLTVENVDVYVAPSDAASEAPSMDETAQGLPGDCFFPTDYALAAAPSDVALSVDGSLAPGEESSAAPYGAGLYDCSLYLAGNVRVTLTIMESNGKIDANVCDWSTSQINSVKTKTREALDWWETMFDKYNPNSPIGLSFTVDYTDATTPFKTSYEPIMRSADEENLWVGEYLSSKGYSGTYASYQSHLSDMRAFNVAQRDASGADWAYSIFVVHSRRPDNSLVSSASGAAGDFAGGGAGAYAWVGGPNVVVSYDCRGWGINRLSTVIAHETGHIFHARDEYAGASLTYNDFAGYYGIQNTNAYEGNPNPSSRVPSIMADSDLQKQAWSGYTSATSTLQTLGWRDSDGDGLIDALDTPLMLTGTGEYDEALKIFRFSGKSSVTALENAMTERWKGDVTLNTVDRLEYKLDGGAWTTLARVSGTSNVSVVGSINIGDAKLVSFRTVCDRTGVTSATLTFNPLNPFNPIDDPLRVTTELDVVDETDGVVSLREAIAAAQEGDAITFDASLRGKTIALNGAEITLSNAVTIDASELYNAANGVPGLTLDAGGKSRIFYVNGGTAENPVELIGLKITGGLAQYAGGVMVYADCALAAKDCVFVDNKTTGSGGGGLCVDGWADLENCVFSGNSANSDGGGIYVALNASLTATGLTITNNSAVSGGGGLHVADSGTATVTDSTLTGNVAAWGGGLHVAGTVIAERVTINENTTRQASGGVDVATSGTLTINNSTIANNESPGDGGGLYIGGTLNASGLTVAGNTAANQGGGLRVNGTATLANSTISGNSAAWGGGALVWGSLTLTDSLVVENATTSSGGGFYVGGEATFRNTVIAENNAGGDGGGILVAGTLTASDLTVADNTASQGGGLSVNGTTTLANSTISGNSATWGGGALVWADLTLTNSLVVENKATSGGGGFYIGGKATFRNATIAANSAGWGGGLQAASDQATTLYNTILAANVGGDVADSGATLNAYNVLSSHTAWDAGANNYVYDASQPLFKDAANGDYALATNSQALDKGNNSYISGYSTDLAGETRVVNGTVDLGSYERQQPTQLSAPSLSVSATSSSELSVEIGSVPNASSYALEYSTSSSFTSSTTVTKTYSSSGTYALTGLSANTTYYVRVKAEGTGAYADSAWSSAKSATTPKITLSTPSLSVSAKSSSEITVTIGNVSNESSYTLEYSTSSSFTSKTTKTYSSSGTYTLSGLSANTTYYVRVKAVGTGAYADSAWSSAKSATTPKIVLSTPSLSVSAKSSSELSVTIGSVANASSYTLEYSTSSSFTSSTTVTKTYSSSGTYALTGLSANTTYYVRVKAEGTGAYADSAWSSAKSATTLANAETPSLVVTTNSDVVNNADGLISLREAIAYAEADSSLGSKITFAASLKGKTITLSGTELTISKGITVDASALYTASTNTPGITIDADQTSRVFYVSGGTSSNPVAFVGLKIAGGNTAQDGGGVCVDGSATFTNSTISGNTASSGGGVYVYSSGSATFTNSTISGNTAKYGGGVCVDGSATFTNSTISGNTASYSVGGVSVSSSGSATFTNSTISGNTASYSGGGGVSVSYSGSATFTNSTISGNTAKYGGGVSVSSSGSATFTNSTISGNTSSYDGGGVCVYGSATFTNSTISGNTSSYGYGDGVYVYSSGSATLYNSIVALNAATSSGADVCDNGGTVKAYNTLSSYASWDAGSSNYAYDSSSPLFTNAANGDYTLAANSQAIDQGNNSYVSGYSTDLAGKTRVVGGTVDLGAYEYQQATTALTSVSISGTAQVGQTLTATVAPSVATATYQWYYGTSASSATTAISGATSKTFALTDAYVGKYIKVVATGSGNYTGSVAKTVGPVVDVETPSLVVTTNSDVVNNADGLISLREAIAYAEADSSLGSKITFAASLKGKTITLSGTELTISKGITVDASALYTASTNTPGITIDANQKSRVFYVSGGTSSNPVAFVGLKIAGGKTTYVGGGVCVYDGSATFTNSTISGNTASSSSGGGVYVRGSATFTNSTISGNTSDYGGGVYVRGSATFTNSTISGNTASSRGGGVYVDYGSATFTNSTISGNTASSCGGVCVDYGSATLYNSIVALNTATSSGADVYDDGGTLNAYNTLSSYTAWDAGSNNYVYDASQPLFADAENGDYRLAAGSQAIDKGNDAYAVDASGAKLTTDLAGENRFVGTVDLGAYELQAQGVEAPGEIVFGAYDVATKKLEMSWGASKNAAKYRVEYSRDGGTTWNNSGVVAASVTSRVATLGYKSAYQFRVRAENANDVSDWVYGSFNPATDARPTAPGTEIKFGSYDAETGKVKMSWSAASNEARYRIEYSRDGGKTWNNSGAVDAGVTSRTATLSYRTSVYHFRVCAENAAGASDWVYGVFDPLSSAQPTAPGNKISFGAYDMATGKIEMSWKDSTGEDNYRVEYSRDGGKTWNNSGVLDADVTSRVATLGYKSEYSFRIRAVNANGLSKWVYGTINPVANLVPTTPGAQITFGAYDASTGKVEMSWSAAENATSYRVEFSRNGGQTWSNSGVFGSNVTSRLATISVKSAVYYFRVRAENAVGVSDWVYGEFQTPDVSSVASSAVSEAFADFFAEEDADDEFWFEFEKALGRRAD